MITIGDLGGGGGMSVIVHGSEELPNPVEQPDARTAAEVTIIPVIRVVDHGGSVARLACQNIARRC
jgi:hypothetical protein